MMYHNNCCKKNEIAYRKLLVRNSCPLKPLVVGAACLPAAAPAAGAAPLLYSALCPAVQGSYYREGVLIFLVDVLPLSTSLKEVITSTLVAVSHHQQPSPPFHFFLFFLFSNSMMCCWRKNQSGIDDSFEIAQNSSSTAVDRH